MCSIRKSILTLVTSVVAVCSSSAQIVLPAIFTDGMVLQRNSNVKIWGWGNPSEKMCVVGSWNKSDTIRTTVNNQGQWELFLPTSQAGGPYEIQILGRNEVKHINNVMLGEVWLCSGQSNMEWSVNSGIYNGEESARNADCNNIRILHIPKQGASSPQVNVSTRWEVSSPESMRKTSATAYFFARCLTQELNVPVGIIVAAWGGTPAEVWTPEEVVMNDTVLSRNKYKEYPWWPIKPGVLFNQMINPIIPYRLAGCIWYQGESNHENATSYSLLMTKLVDEWRKRFSQDFPFYYVQIAPHTYKSKNNTPALLREQQQLVLDKVENSGMINISDLVDDVKDIHPRNKKDIGERLAFMVLDRVYGKFTKPYESPFVKDACLKGRNIIINFGGNFEKLVSVSKNIIGISVVDDNGAHENIKCKIKDKQLIIPVRGLKSPMKVYYCFNDSVIGSLRSNDMIPVLPFRIENLDRK